MCVSPHGVTGLQWALLKYQAFLYYWNRVSCCDMDRMTGCHKVEAPSVVDPQWNMLFWRPRWNFHTVCWGPVCCEWGTTSVYFRITCVCFISKILLVFAMGPKNQYHFYLCQKAFEWNKKIFPCRFRTGMDKYWWSLKLLPFEVFFSCLFDVLLGVTYVNMRSPLSEHCNT